MSYLVTITREAEEDLRGFMPILHLAYCLLKMQKVRQIEFKRLYEVLMSYLLDIV